MASDRVSVDTCKLIGVPPYEVRSVTTRFVLQQEEVKKNIHKVPLNEKLVKSILNEGIKNPSLHLANWYPLAGSQRIRAVQHIVENIDSNWNQNIQCHRFTEDWHNCFYLWPDIEFRNKAIAIWFQLQEVVFKSLYYEHDVDESGTEMTEFEDIGEELEWEHDRTNRNTSSNNILSAIQVSDESN